MHVLRVVAEGMTTSFRYPHFMQQIHPTYEMPPPATIYGHICSALGEWFDPTGVAFAYHFTFDASVTDLEHIIVLSPATGKLPRTGEPKVLEGNVTPFNRDLLFRPRLTLYINRPDWLPAFRSPRFAVVLGRSQDLFTYRQVDVIELVQRERAYFEHTIAPHEMALQFGRGVTLLMPQYVDYEQKRRPRFKQYVMLRERVLLPSEEILQFSSISYGPYWVDPTTPAIDGVHLGLIFHRFLEDEG